MVARACPWANRTMIVRRLLGLEPALSMGICGPEHDWRSWTFDLDPGEVDPVLGIGWLREAFEKAVPGYDQGVTVPAIVEVASAAATADYRQITLDLEHEWTAFHRPGAPDLYPDKLRDEIEEDQRRGLRGPEQRRVQVRVRQHAGCLRGRLRQAVRPPRRSVRAARQPPLPGGDTITEADVRLWPTLVRFDAVYHGHFKCNRNKLTEMPGALWAYARDLYQTPGFGDTIDFIQTKEHYYRVHTGLNPSKIVPAGPDLSGLAHPAPARGTRRAAVRATERRRVRRRPQNGQRGTERTDPAARPRAPAGFGSRLGLRVR